MLVLGPAQFFALRVLFITAGLGRFHEWVIDEFSQARVPECRKDSSQKKRAWQWKKRGLSFG